MNHLIHLFRKYKTYYVAAFVFIFAGLVGLLFIEKGEFVYFLNGIHTDSLDTFFVGLTCLGEAWGGVLVFFLLYAFASKRYLITFCIAVILSLLISQGFKHLVFNNEHRPSYYIDTLEEVEGIEHHRDNSFPSGHTTAAFTFFTLLAVGLRKSWVQFASALLATGVGVSRVYLGQHFLNDIVVGSILGIFIATGSILLVDRFLASRGQSKQTN